MKVFIVEDSGLVTAYLVEALREIHGVEIVGYATNPADAIVRIGESAPDVLILDLRLSEGSGIEVLRRVKSGPRAPIVIVLSNYTCFEYRERCRELGAEYFFDKALEFDRAAEVLRQLCGEHEHIRPMEGGREEAQKHRFRRLKNDN